MDRRTAIPLAALLVLAACGDDESDTSAVPEPTDAQEISYRERLTTIDDAVRVWADAESIDVAHAAAEAAANLVVGADGPDHGDRDGNGVVDGDTAVGVLPGLDGLNRGLAEPLAANSCIFDDVLGGDWDDPQQRWATMDDAVAAWSPDNNTMPSLPSHPMRVVGWSTFTLDSDSLELAHEYAGHAQLHVDVSLRALDCGS